MWPFSSQVSAQATNDDLTEEQVKKLFEDASSSPSKKVEALDAPASSTSQRSSIPNAASELPDAEPCALQYYFDEFFMCYTPKSQLRNWYRYGEQKDCSERWRDLKWCMQTRMADEGQSQAMLRRWQIDQLKRIRSGPNSEDVWQIRNGGMQTSPWKGPDAGEDYSIS